jgi:hypothetical protein
MSDSERRDRVLAGACIECGGHLSAGCPHCNGTGLEPKRERWFYMSFADPSLPKGSQFLGGCYVHADTLQDAIVLTHTLGINPGGEVRVDEVPSDALEENVPAKDRHRLLTREEIEAAE